MPVYQCCSPQGLLTTSARTEIAEEITRIHCNATGAPRSFVNVLFLEAPQGAYFTGGQPSGHSLIFGQIRDGRDLETRQMMLRDLSEMWTRLTGQTEAELIVALNESKSENIMEAGLIFPAAGHEQQWFDENRARLAELGWTTA